MGQDGDNLPAGPVAKQRSWPNWGLSTFPCCGLPCGLFPTRTELRVVLAHSHRQVTTNHLLQSLRNVLWEPFIWAKRPPTREQTHQKVRLLAGIPSLWGTNSKFADPANSGIHAPRMPGPSPYLLPFPWSKLTSTYKQVSPILRPALANSVGCRISPPPPSC